MPVDIEATYKKVSPRAHVLLRPDTYLGLGSVEYTRTPTWVYDAEEDKLVFREVSYVPGLYKIFDEILVNAADNKQRDPKMNTIKVDIDKENNSISVWNNGRGIPVAVHKTEKMYVPEMLFGTLLTSSSYNDDEKKTTGGRNGYGAKLTNIFSKKFTVETSSQEYGKKFKQTWVENMEMKMRGGPQISSATGEDFTKVVFQPDLKRFKMDELEDDIIGLMCTRVYDVAGTSRGVKVYLNGRKLPSQSIRPYVEQYTSQLKNDGGSPVKLYFDVGRNSWAFLGRKSKKRKKKQQQQQATAANGGFGGDGGFGSSGGFGDGGAFGGGGSGFTPGHSSENGAQSVRDDRGFNEGSESVSGSIITSTVGVGRQAVRRNMVMIGKTVRIRAGPMKGYIGIVKDATESTVNVKFNTMLETVNFDIDKVMEVGGERPTGLMDTAGGVTPGFMGASGRTPMYGGAQMPMYGGGFGSATPMHDSFGSRTPHYGSMTPAYDGSRTSSHQPSASWDPTVANTPAHSTGHFDDEYDSGEFGSSAGFGNGGFGGAATPAGSTHGGSRFGGATPMHSAATPRDPFADSSPFGSSFSSGPSQPTTNASPHPSRTPMGASTMGPQEIPDEELRTGFWCAVDMNVQVRRTFSNENLFGIEGTIRSVKDAKCVVYFGDLDQEHKIRVKHLLPAKPSELDQARVLYGPHKGANGTMISVETDEGVMQQSNGVIKLFPLSILCKIRPVKEE